MKLSEGQIAELEALRQNNDALKGPSFIMRFHWRESGYCTLVRRGLVKWGAPPAGFDPKRFAGTEITEAGCKALSEPGQ